MLRRSLTLSLVFPLLVLLMILMFAVAFDSWVQRKMPEIRVVSAALVVLVVAWIPVSVYLLLRRRVLTPLRELWQKLMRADMGRLETMRQPALRDEMGDVVFGYNQMVSTLATEREERLRYERERLLQSQLVALGIQADGLAHELASPLSTLSTLAKLSAEGDMESARDLEKEARALSERLKRFMALFRSRQVSVRPLDAARLVAERVAIQAGGGIEIRMNAEDRSFDILSDEVLVTEILDNILKNAVRHARTTAHVDVSLTETEFHVTLSDDGPGISGAAAERLFRPFFTTTSDGHGLGLFISRIWAQALGGRLELAAGHHAKLGGASFRLALPAQRRGGAEV